MTRVETMREEVQRLVRVEPFEPFVITLESGQNVLIEHPENIAFDPSAKPEQQRANQFYVVTQQVRLFSHFDSITSITTADRGE